MKHRFDRAQFAQVALAFLAYILWLITAGLGIVDILVARRLLLEVAYALDANPWAQGAIDKFGLVTLGVGWLILTYAAEAHYRKATGVSLRKLLRSFVLVTGTQIVFGGLAVLVTLLLM